MEGGGFWLNQFSRVFVQLDFTRKCTEGLREKRFKSLTNVWSSKEFVLASLRIHTYKKAELGEVPPVPSLPISL